VKFNSELRSRNSIAMWAKRSPEQRAAIAKKIGDAHRGRRATAATREKLSLAHLGHTPWNKGRKETRPEVIERFRQSHLGKKRSPEAIEKHRQAMLGHECRPETREKIRAKMLGRKITWADKISATNIGRKHTRATKKIIAAASSAHWKNSSYRSTVTAGIRAAKTSIEGRAKCSAASRKIWANPAAKKKRAQTLAKPSVRRKMQAGAEKGLRSARRKPNGLEQTVGALLNDIALGQWRYNGGGLGAKKIAGYFPDFVCDRQKKIIEVDGEYWHKDVVRDRKRNAAYRKNGYLLLVVKSSAVYNGTANKRLEKFCHG